MSRKRAIDFVIGAVVCGLVLVWYAPAKAANSDDQICDTRADYFLGIEDYPEAIRLHQALLAARPDDALAHYHLGFAYGMVGKREDEVAEYRRAAALGLPDWDLYLNLGRAYLESGDFTSALGPLRKAATLGPNRAEAHFNLGLADERLGMLEPAKREFETALKLDPAQPDTLNMLGLVYAEKRDYSQARRIWSRLSHEHPEFRPSHVNLAILSLATNRPGWSRSGELDDSSPRAEERRTLSSAASP